jgi:hypothetical protein
MRPTVRAIGTGGKGDDTVLLESGEAPRRRTDFDLEGVRTEAFHLLFGAGLSCNSDLFWRDTAPVGQFDV